MTSGKVYFYGSTNPTTINADLTNWSAVWGFTYTNPSTPVVNNLAAWPGTSQLMAGPFIPSGSKQYVALKFHTPATGNVISTITGLPTSYQQNGGGVNDRAKMTFTVSTQCGDFRQTSTSRPANCAFSNKGSSDTMIVTTKQNLTSYCLLEKNKDYYLNIMYAPLADSSNQTTPNTCTDGGSIALCNVLWQNNFTTPN